MPCSAPCPRAEPGACPGDCPRSWPRARGTRSIGTAILGRPSLPGCLAHRLRRAIRRTLSRPIPSRSAASSKVNHAMSVTALGPALGRTLGAALGAHAAPIAVNQPLRRSWQRHGAAAVGSLGCVLTRLGQGNAFSRASSWPHSGQTTATCLDPAPSRVLPTTLRGASIPSSEAPVKACVSVFGSHMQTDVQASTKCRVASCRAC